MAKRKTAKKRKKKTGRGVGGPFLAAAVYCEGISEDIDGILSVAKIIDSVNLLIPPQAPADIPSHDKPVTLNPSVLVVFRSGEAPGKHKLSLVVQQPDGKRTEVLAKDVEMSQPLQGGINVKVRTEMKVFSGGVYWTDVILDGEVFTRMPLNISIQRADSAESVATDDRASKPVRPKIGRPGQGEVGASR